MAESGTELYCAGTGTVGSTDDGCNQCFSSGDKGFHTDGTTCSICDPSDDTDKCYKGYNGPSSGKRRRKLLDHEGAYDGGSSGPGSYGGDAVAETRPHEGSVEPNIGGRRKLLQNYGGGGYYGGSSGPGNSGPGYYGGSSGPGYYGGSSGPGYYGGSSGPGYYGGSSGPGYYGGGSYGGGSYGGGSYDGGDTFGSWGPSPSTEPTLLGGGPVSDVEYKSPTSKVFLGSKSKTCEDGEKKLLLLSHIDDMANEHRYKVWVTNEDIRQSKHTILRLRHECYWLG
jgi:hypothetical protein